MRERSGGSIFGRILTFFAILGAINWGLIGVFNYNLVNAILGGPVQMAASNASRILYAIVGVAGLCALPFLFVRARAIPRGRLHVNHDRDRDVDYTGRDYVRP